MTVDGADELDDKLNLIKGGGGAHLREKIVASSSKEMIVIADGSKHVGILGAFPLPIEVVEFGSGATLQKITAAAASLGCEGQLSLRQNNGDAFKTDSGNIIYDFSLGEINDPSALSKALSSIPGVVDHGLFIGICSLAIIASEAGVKEIKV